MYHLSPGIVALPNKRVQPAAAAGYRGENWLCNALRVEADFGKVPARLTRRSLSWQGSATKIGCFDSR
jgi:hypothetical protein